MCRRCLPAPLLTLFLLLCSELFAQQGSNTPPFGYVDEPSPGVTVAGYVWVGGWVLDREDPGLLVQFVVDGQVISASPYRWDRPDVCAHPVAAGITHCVSNQP